MTRRLAHLEWCSKCDGSGYHAGQRCSKCVGLGVVVVGTCEPLLEPVVVKSGG